MRTIANIDIVIVAVYIYMTEYLLSLVLVFSFSRNAIVKTIYESAKVDIRAIL